MLNNKRNPIVVTVYSGKITSYKASLFVYIPGIIDTDKRFVIEPKYQRLGIYLGGQELMRYWGRKFVDRSDYLGLEVQSVSAETISELESAEIKARNNLRKQLQDLYPEVSS